MIAKRLIDFEHQTKAAEVLYISANVSLFQGWSYITQIQQCSLAQNQD